MRLDTIITKQGYFWLPQYPDRKLSGSLTIKDRGIITLNILGSFDEDNHHANNLPSYERILGSIESYGDITLIDCFYTRKRKSRNINISDIFVNRALLGISFQNNEEELFKDFIFSIEGIEEWISISGLHTNTVNSGNKKSTYSYTHPKEDIIKLNNGMQLTIQFHFLESNELTGKNINISEKNYFKLTSATEISLNQFISTAYKITTFLCLANNQIVSINSAQATSSLYYYTFNNGDRHLEPIHIFYASNPYDETAPSISAYDMLFRFPDIKQDPQFYINKWIDLYSIIEPSLNLYFDAEKYRNTDRNKQLLMLIQGLESLHRNTSNEKYMNDIDFSNLVSLLSEACPEEHLEWLKSKIIHGNDLPLRKRLLQLISRFNKLTNLNNKERNRLAQQITKIRNYLTHYDQSLKKEALEHNKYELFLKVKIIFQLLLLEKIGFSEEVLEKIYTKDFKRYFNYKK